jgi:CheY-like chemotaxis protein
MTRMVEILLVEDNADHVELTLRALRMHNLANRVHVTKDGAEALDFVFGKGAHADRDVSLQPKVILLDLNLPKISGMEVLAKVKSDERTRAIPVVILTSSQQERDMVESYRLGANSYISKPVGFDKFAAAVSQLGLYWVHLNECPY